MERYLERKAVNVLCGMAAIYTMTLVYQVIASALAVCTHLAAVLK